MISEWALPMEDHLAQPWDCESRTHSVVVMDRVSSSPWLCKIDNEFYNQLKSKYIKNTESHYDILGIKPSATTDEIKKAYKNLCKQYHPDKVQHLGDEFKNFADEKIKEINKAYDSIMQKAKA